MICLFLLLALPLAVGITPSESKEILTSLFTLMKKVLPEDSFYNGGKSVGPEFVMTDDSTSEQAALMNAWPQ
mgnify:FL=1